MQNILIFTKNWLGDVIFEEPFIRFLKDKYPSSKIICITNQRTCEIVSANPNVAEVIVFDDRNKDKSLFSVLKLILKLRQKKIDKAFLLHRSFSRALILFLAGIPKRYGYNTKHRGFLLTKKVEEPIAKSHRVDYWLEMLKRNKLIENVPCLNYRFYYAEQSKIKILSLLQSVEMNKERFICINPGANWDKKKWPLDRFAMLINRLYEKYKIDIVITGAEKDIVFSDAILADVCDAKVVSFCGKTNIGELAALFAMSKLLISADSGPLHIAGGVGTNVIAIFGPTDALETGPRGEGKKFVLQELPRNCTTPCFDKKCVSNECMLNITVEEVLRTIDSNKLC